MFKNLRWISSEIPDNTEKLDKLSMRMQKFYSTNQAYYDNILESESYWSDQQHLIHQQIISEVKNGNNILELGCGESPILKFHPDLQKKYTGLDFSEKIIEKNREKYPEACFESIKNPYNYELPSKSFDVIFSVFVIEHTVYPKKFLDECIRLLKTGGKLILLAPNFLDNGFLPSENINPEIKSGRELLKERKFLGALKTLIFNKFLIPFNCKRLAKKTSGFFINIEPACFYTNVFKPDVDAVYIVSEKEIDLYLSKKDFDCQALSQDIEFFKRKNRFVYQVYIKN